MHTSITKVFVCSLLVLSSLIFTPAIYAVIGDVQLDVSSGGSIIGSAVAVSKITDSANAAYYLDPASNPSMNVAGSVTAPTFVGALTGNSSTATTFSTGRTNYSGVTNGAVTGQMMWKNYGNSHTIFDASNSTSPDGGAVNNTNSAVAWTGTYPTLMGWNGSSTYGVRVDSARLADTATTATNQSGGSVSATNVDVDSVTRLDSSGNYTVMYDQSAAAALYLGGTGDPTDYFDNTVHKFRGRSGASETLRITPGNYVESFYPLYSEGPNMQFKIYDTDVAKLWALSSFGDTGIAFCEDASGNTCRLMIAAGGKTGIGVNPDATYTLKVGGSTANTTGVWTNYSDKRLKHDIVPISNALSTILQLKPVAFNWNDPQKDKELGRVRGFIAQDVEKIVPEWIVTDTTGYKAIQPIGMDAMLVGSVQDQQQEIESLQQTVKLQQEQIDRLKSQVGALLQK